MSEGERQIKDIWVWKKQLQESRRKLFSSSPAAVPQTLVIGNAIQQQPRSLWEHEFFSVVFRLALTIKMR